MRLTFVSSPIPSTDHFGCRRDRAYLQQFFERIIPGALPEDAKAFAGISGGGDAPTPPRGAIRRTRPGADSCAMFQLSLQKRGNEAWRIAKSHRSLIVNIQRVPDATKSIGLSARHDRIFDCIVSKSRPAGIGPGHPQSAPWKFDASRRLPDTASAEHSSRYNRRTFPHHI